jgi:hypothetical protein
VEYAGVVLRAFLSATPAGLPVSAILLPGSATIPAAARRKDALDTLGIAASFRFGAHGNLPNKVLQITPTFNEKRLSSLTS